MLDTTIELVSEKTVNDRLFIQLYKLLPSIHYKKYRLVLVYREEKNRWDIVEDPLCSIEGDSIPHLMAEMYETKKDFENFKDIENEYKYQDR